ncbi:MAG TPA: hypothetical protein VE221_03820 [Sphingomicrobium sp.]|nr:hypothetical protein [Sphingomicrobium sp.]
MLDIALDHAIDGGLVRYSLIPPHLSFPHAPPVPLFKSLQYSPVLLHCRLHIAERFAAIIVALGARMLAVGEAGRQV